MMFFSWDWELWGLFMLKSYDIILLYVCLVFEDPILCVYLPIICEGTKYSLSWACCILSYYCIFLWQFLLKIWRSQYKILLVIYWKIFAGDELISGYNILLVICYIRFYYCPFLWQFLLKILKEQYAILLVIYWKIFTLMN